MSPETVTMSGAEVTIDYEKPLLNAAKEIYADYPQVKRDLEHDLGLTIDFHPVIVLAREQAFRSFVEDEAYAAFAVPADLLIVIDYSRVSGHAFGLNMVLKHELCHLALHHNIGQDLPKWLDEGVCQWVSRGASEILADKKGSFLNPAVLAGTLIRLEDLSVRFPDGKNALFLAYEESKSFVGYVDSIYGAGKVSAILQSMRQGHVVQAAIRENLSMSLQDLEAKWSSHLRKRVTWPYYLASYLYEILFVVAALLTIYAFAKIMVTRQVKKRQDENEDVL